MFDIFMLGASIIFLIIGLIDYRKHKRNGFLVASGTMMFGYIFVKVIDTIFK
ncbi:hypothetical protein [Clostridium sp. DJ247]|uniref:hypothetical protein n=1 Tax=Clostridium sp. DJ247 TaxID=2726188 RepID=UPI001624700F|nr:hypothetical protein [Clostridium sp. DJ247]MBC2580610.1 hypothetical protein [Clostridium sp. DJ247]